MLRRQASKAAEEKLRAINSGKMTPYSVLTFAEFVDQFFIPLIFPVLKPSTTKRYRSTFKNHLLPAFGQRRLCDIRAVDVQRFVLEKIATGLGWEMANHLRNLISKVFEDAKRFGHFGGDNPAGNIQLPEKKSVRERQVLTAQQIPALLHQLVEPVRTAVLLAIHTGLRVGELLGLQWRDVNFITGELHVQRTLYRGTLGTPKTKSSNRHLPLTPEARSALQAHYAAGLRRESSDFLFQTRNGTPFSDTNLLHRFLKPAGKAIGAPWLHWHSLRYTCATLLVGSGASVKDVQSQLGHAQATTTLNIYAQTIPSQQREAVERMGRLVTNGDELAGAAMERPRPALSIQ
jgi:integrase